MNFERRIHDCSRSQYHNQKFKEAAEEFGLKVEQVPHYGFAKTSVPAKTLELYTVEIAGLTDALVHRRKPIIIVKPAPPEGGTGEGSEGADGEDTDDTPTSRHFKATCFCDPPFIIRVSRRTLAETQITCSRCGQAFEIR